MPKCHLRDENRRKQEEIHYLYEIANLPEFLKERGFTMESGGEVKKSTSPYLKSSLKPYYRDYICEKGNYGYQSLHITFYDNSARCYMEVQLRTKESVFF